MMGQKDILIALMIFAVELILFYYLWRNNLLLTISLATLSFFVLLKWADKQERIMFIAGFLMGPIYDLVLVPAGVWTYGAPTIFNVPAWLPVAYGLGIVILVKIGKNAAQLYSERLQQSL